MSKKVKQIAEPNFITRRDREMGRWTVEECAPKRGDAYTDPIGRRVVAPIGTSELDRLIRAHELMHAKISPADDWEKWVDRAIATKESMISVEEVRVNMALTQLGFDLSGLTDNNEDADGEYCAIHEQWDAAVRFAVGTAGTGGGKKFLVGVRRHNKKWADALAKIQKRVLKELASAEKKRHNLYSTRVSRAGIAPEGFLHVERLGEYIDRLTEHPPQEEAPTQADATSGETESDDDGDTTKVGVGSTEKVNDPTKDYKEVLREIVPMNDDSWRNMGEWSKLVWGKVPLHRVANGKLGRKRIASAVGKNPRRIQRLLTDPQMRVFDRVQRGSGGVVLIDGSGSMTLSHKNVLRILEASPGAIVAIYSDMDEGKGEKPNIHILAKDGKMVASDKEMPRFGAGNGCDLPALEWAIKQRERGSTPVVWVTDGGVCTSGGGWAPRLAVACIKTAQKHNVLCVEDTDEAVDALKKLNSRKPVERKWPEYFRHTIENIGGMSKLQSVGK